MARPEVATLRGGLVALGLVLAACTGPRPAPDQHELPPGWHLASAGLAADGRSLLVVGAGSGACFTPALYALEDPPQQLATAPGPAGRGQASDEGACTAWTASAASDGGRLAIYLYNRGEVHLYRREGARLTAEDVLLLPGEPAFRFPPPGPNLALSADGGTLLVGAVERDCRRLAAGVRCGTAYLYRREVAVWRLAATLERPAGAGEAAQFGGSLLLLPDGAALAGGTGLAGGPGALHLFLPGPGGFLLAQTLLPEARDEEDEFFATDLAASGDGAWLAVGAAQQVQLYRREGRRFVPAGRLDPPDLEAGHFGEAVALDGEGRTLLVGAPRAGCAKGARCGLVYRYERAGEGWRLAGRHRAAVERVNANFGHALSLDARGRVSAVEGHAVQIERP